MKTTLYKLVDQNWETRGGMKWELNKTNYATGEGNELCTNGVLHAYVHPLLAVFLNPIHAGISNPVLLEVTTEAVIAIEGHDSDKGNGATRGDAQSTGILWHPVCNERID